MVHKYHQYYPDQGNINEYYHQGDSLSRSTYWWMDHNINQIKHQSLLDARNGCERETYIGNCSLLSLNCSGATQLLKSEEDLALSEQTLVQRI